jgi:hypothetical protein
MTRAVLTLRLTVLLMGASLLGAAAAAGTTASPKSAVAHEQSRWLSELRASAGTGDLSAIFPSPAWSLLMRRLRQAQKLYGFQIVSVRVLHPLQSAPVIIIRSDHERTIAHATRSIVKLLDPYHPTNGDPSGYAYEGYFFVAQDTNGVPYLATFNFERAPHVGGGEWAADPSLYPFPHW